MKFQIKLLTILFLTSVLGKVYAQSYSSLIPYSSSLYNNSSFSRTSSIALKPVGVVKGLASTNPNGASTYVIPIQCPPGTNGMSPNVSLVYNSQGGSGIAGLGWNISGGMSVISRGGNDIYHDGIVKPVQYNNNDVFLLDGIRLFPTSGSNGANGTTYRTESESYSVTTSYNYSGDGSSPEKFRVVNKDGTKMEFGYTTDSRIMSNDFTKVMMWRLNRIEDINGNYIEFVYDNTDRDSRISEIKYTGNSATGLIPYNSISFSYATRQDKNITYDCGYSIESKYILYEIQVKSEGEVFKKYQPHYGKDATTSFLKEFIEFTPDETVLNETRFKYGDKTTEVAESINYDFIMPTLNTNISTADFDGDGLSDFLVSEYTNYPFTNDLFNVNLKIKKRTNTSTTYTTCGSLSFSGIGKRVENQGRATITDTKALNSQYADFNGDGREDIIVSNISNDPSFKVLLDISIYYTNPDGSLPTSPSYIYYPLSHWIASPEIIHGTGGRINYFQVGDFDGDGLSDFITMVGNKVYFNSPIKGIENKLITVFNLTTTSVPSGLTPFEHLFKHASQITVVNMDGDAKSELMVVAGSYTRILRIDKVGIDFQISQIGADLGYPSEWHDIYFGDFNGDGKTDILTGPVRGLYSDHFVWSIGYYDGTKFKEDGFLFDHFVKPQAHGFTSTDRILIGDFNGDGKSDILDIFIPSGGSSIFNMYSSRGKDFVLSKIDHSYTPSIGYCIGVADYNGDSKAELFSRPGVSVNGLFTSFNPHQKSHLLEKINDGFDRTTEFTYEPLTKGTGIGTGDFFTKGTGSTYPINNCQFPIYVSTSIKSIDGIGGLNITNNKYENIRLHRAGRGLIGFEKVKSINLNSDIRSESYYDFGTDFYAPYEKTTKTFLNTTGVQLSQTESTNLFERIGTTYCYIQKLTSTVSQDFLKNITSTSTNTFDAFGNITYSSNVTTGGSLTMTSTSTTNFISTGGSLIPNRPSEIVTTNKRGSQPTVSTKNTITYHPNGLVKSSMTSPTSSTINNVKNSFEYDAFGNITSSVKSTFSAHSPHSPTTKYEYDSKGRFVISEENTLGNKKYITTHKFWGKPLSVTDYNGLISSYTYDKWGKLTSSTIPTSLSTSYTVNYSDGWDLGTNQLYYTYTHDPSSPDVKTWYDYLGRPVKTKQETFGGAWVESKITYDAKGNVASSTNNYLPTETPSVTNNTYDGFNRMLSSTNVFGTTNYAYSLGSGEESTTITLPDGKVKKTVLDASGKLIKSSNGIAGTVHYEYNSWGNEIASSIGTTTMGYHTLIQKEYDVKGMLKKMIDQDAGITTYEYNTYGQLFKQIDPKGKATIYQYDAAGRVSQKNQDGFITNYSYYGNIKDYALQRIVVTSPTGDVVEDYCDYAIGGEMTKHIKTINGVAIEKRFTYDVFNNPLTTENINSGFKTKNYYDPKGFLQKITTNFTPTPSLEKTLYEATNMNGNGQVTNFKRVDGLNSTVSYYNGIANNYTTSGVQDLSTVYNYTNGNVISRFDNITQTKEDFEYDAIDRLTKAEAQKLGALGMMHIPITMSYNNGFWGSFGQIATKSDVGIYAYGGFPRNAVKSVTDPATIISHETQDITYTPFDKAQKITEKIGANYYEEKFVYDGNEDRAYSQQSQGPISPSSILRKRWYMGDFEIDQKLTGSAKTHQLHYISSDVGLVGIVVEEGGNYKYYAAYTDHLGSIVTLTDDVGTVIAKQSYDPWGRERNPDTWGYAPTVTSGGGTPTPPEWLYRGYTGHEMLPEYGLINMNGRMYDPMNGRMMRPDNLVSDPLNTQDYNRYSYCYNNPLKYTDPTGDYAVVDDIAMMLIGGAINVAVNWKNIKSFENGAAYFGSGVVGGAVSLYVGPAVGAAVTGAANTAITSYNQTGTVNLKAVAQSAVMSGIMGGLTSSLGNAVSSTVGSTFAGISNPVLRSALTQGAIGGGLGAATAFVSGGNVLEGAAWGLGTGLATGLYAGYRAVKANKKSNDAADNDLIDNSTQREPVPDVDRLPMRGPGGAEGTTGFRYMTEGELKVIQETNLLRGGNPGETYFTKDIYKSASKASQRLGLENTPTYRVEFKIINNPRLLRNGTKVQPLKGLSGKGAEFMTTDPVKVKLINWQPIK